MTAKDSDPPVVPKLLAETMINGLETSREAISKVQDKVSSIDKNLALVNQSQEDMKKSLDCLLKIIRDGNGKQSLLDRVSTLEADQKLVNAYMQENKTVKAQSVQGRWQTKVALISGLMGLIGTAITVLVANWPF